MDLNGSRTPKELRSRIVDRNSNGLSDMQRGLERMTRITVSENFRC